MGLIGLKAYICAGLLALGGGCAEVGIRQPDRVHYGVQQFRWRKGEGDKSSARWSTISKAITGNGFPSLHDEAMQGEAYGTTVDLDWKLHENEDKDQTFLNFRLGYAEMETRHRITSHRIPALGKVVQRGNQATLEFGLSHEIALMNEDSAPYVFGTARIGLYQQNQGGHGNALIGGVVPLFIREDYSVDCDVYGGVEAGLRIPLDNLLSGSDIRINGAEPSKAHLTIGAMTNYYQTTFGISITISR